MNSSNGRPPISDHFNGKKFFNSPKRANGFWALLRWVLNRQQGEWKETRQAVLRADPARQVPGPGERDDALRITLVNHSTFLIQTQGLNLLTDPIWSERASPVQWAGPKRMRPPGLRFEQLPKIDAVLLSHDHYDHMDELTLRRLWLEFRPAFFTGFGNGARLRRWQIHNVVEMDWWNDASLPGGLRLTCAPARHFSGRTPFDRDRTLWCSFVIDVPAISSGAIYFAADTGFGPHFAEVAQRFPDIRVALLPIGAFRPEWFMGEVHCSPEQAVEAHRVLGAAMSIGCHFGTFPLADDGEGEAEQRLREAALSAGVEREFVVPKFGVGIEVPSKSTFTTETQRHRGMRNEE